MKPADSLEELERRAYRSTFADGLYDIPFGLVFLILAWIPALETAGISRFYSYGLFIFPILVSWLGKRHITMPRLGTVEFGPKRKSRSHFLFWTGAVIVVLTLPLVPMIIVRGLPGGLAWMTIAVFVAPLAAIGVFIMDYPRLYVYAALLLAGVVEAEFLLKYIGTPFNALVSFGVPGLGIVAYGATLLCGFIKKYPVQSREAPYVG
jgi:hypothetical protein